MSDVISLTELNNSLQSQLEAHQGMLNEQLQSNIMLRTQLVGLQREYQKLQAQIVELNKQIEDLSQPAVQEQNPDLNAYAFR